MKEYFYFFSLKLNQFHYIKPDKFPITGQLTNIIPPAPQMAWYLLYLSEEKENSEDLTRDRIG